MTEVNISGEAQGDGSHVNPAPAEPKVETVPQGGNQSPEDTLALINKELGQNFKDLPSALKSWKDTNSYVGKKKEDIAAELAAANKDAELSKEIKQIKENMFFKDNPDLAEYRTLLAKIDSNPEVAAQSPEFQAIFGKAKGYDESAKLKTVLNSNPRLAASNDGLKKGKELLATGNKEAGESAITQAVMEAFSD